MTKDKAQENMQTKKHEMSVRSMYFSRYLMIRYFSAAYLFANMFWFIFSICYQNLLASIISGVIFLLCIIASIEQASKWHNKDTNLKYTVLFYLVQCVLNIFLCAVCYTSIGKNFIPFMTSTDIANIMMTILLAGIVGSIIVLRRIYNISSGKDRYLKAIRTFESNKQ